MSSTSLNVFFDTSALVKYFYDEPGSDQVVELMTVPSAPTSLRRATRSLDRRYKRGEP